MKHKERHFFFLYFPEISCNIKGFLSFTLQFIVRYFQWKVGWDCKSYFNLNILAKTSGKEEKNGKKSPSEILHLVCRPWTSKWYSIYLCVVFPDTTVSLSLHKWLHKAQGPWFKSQPTPLLFISETSFILARVTRQVLKRQVLLQRHNWSPAMLEPRLGFDGKYLSKYNH